MFGFSSYIVNNVGVDAPEFNYVNSVYNYFAGIAVEVVPPSGAISMSIRAISDLLYVGLDAQLSADTAPWALTKNALLTLPINSLSGQKYYLLGSNDGAAAVVFQVRV